LECDVSYCHDSIYAFGKCHSWLTPFLVHKYIETSPRFEEFEKLADQIGELDKQAEDLDRLWVKCQRLIRTAESAAMAVNLPKLAKAEIRAKYRALVAAEEGVIGGLK